MTGSPAPSPDGPPAHDAATPPELRGLIDFVNSRQSAKRAERFDSPEHAQSFLTRCDLDYDRRPLTAADVRRLRRLRDAVMAAVERPDDDAVWSAIDEISATVPLRLHTAGGPSFGLRATRDSPADVIIASVLDRLTGAIATGRWERLGACARCRRVFYDSTRSRTRRWCSYATCGNRANVASYRDRTRTTD